MSAIRRLFVGILLLALLLFPFFGQYFGSGVRPLEMLTALEPQYLAASFLLLAIAFLLRRPWLIALAIVTASFHAWQVVPWYFGKPSIPSDTPGLKMVSFNVLHQNQHFDQAISWVIEQEPQVAVFQEVTPPWPEKLQKLRTAFPFHFRADDLQMDIFSKLPILNPEPMKVGIMRGFIRFQVEVNHNPVTIYATHTYPQVPLGVEGFRFHHEQLTKVMPEDITHHPDRPLVVLGDLNSTMWSPHYRALVQSTGLRNARQGFGIAPSLSNENHWSQWTAVAFDHCLVRGDIAVESFATGPYLGSDHLPIIITLRLPNHP